MSNQFVHLEDEFMSQSKLPWVFLAGQDLHSDLITEATHLFRLEFKKVDNDIFLFSKDLSLNHKEKALVLFFTSLFLSSKQPKAALCLGQYNTLAQRIQMADQLNKNIIFSETQAESYKSWPREVGLILLQNEFKIYLEHAGFTINEHSINGSQWAQKYLNENQEFAKLRKAG